MNRSGLGTGTKKGDRAEAGRPRNFDMLQTMVRDLPIESIRLRADARQVSDDAVAALSESIASVGLINPIRVRQAGDNWEVVAGAHRIDACRRLGLVDIACIVVDDDDLHAELAMIDENLCRAELSPVDRARQTARRKAIYLVLHPETAKEAFKGNQHVAAEKFSVASFADDTAAKTGTSDRIVRLQAERGEKVIDEVLDMIRGTKLDTGSYLDVLKKMPPNEQVTAAKRDLARLRTEGKPKPARKPAPPLNDIETMDAWLSSGMSWWNRGSKEWREEFLSRIETPVFDAGNDDMAIPVFMRRTA